MDFSADPFVKMVLRDGTDIRKVLHHGRSVPAELVTALEATGSPLRRPRLLPTTPGSKSDHGNPSGSLSFALAAKLPRSWTTPKAGPSPSGTPNSSARSTTD